MKTKKLILNNIKDTSMWMELCVDLKADKFKSENPDLEEDDLWDKFYEEVTSKHFEYGEYGSIEIEVDENFNITGGKIIPFNR